MDTSSTIRHHRLRWPHHLLVVFGSLFFLLWFVPYYEALPGSKNSLDNPNEKTRVFGMASVGLFGEMHINRVRGMWWIRQTDLAGRKKTKRDPKDAPNFLIYPGKTPGFSVFLGPLYGAYRRHVAWKDPSLYEATYFARLFGTILPTLLTALLLYLLLLRICASGYVILTGYAVFLLGTLTYPYALTVSSHSVAGGLLLMLFLSFLWCPRSIWQRILISFGGGLCLGLAFGAEYTAVVSGVIIGIVGLWRRPPMPARYATQPVPRGIKGFFFFFVIRWHILFTFLGSVIPAAAILWFHKVSFGSYFQTPYWHLLNPAFRSANKKGFFGLLAPDITRLIPTLFSPSHGLFFWTPFLLLCIPGLVMLWRKRPLRFLAPWLLILCGFWFFHNSLLLYARGGWTVGPRYIANLNPFLCLLAIWTADQLYRKYGNRAAFFISFFALWSILHYAPASALFPHFPSSERFPPVDIVSTMLQHGLTPTNLLNLPPGWATLIYFCVLALLCVAICVGGFVGRRRILASLCTASLVFVCFLILFQLAPTNYNHRQYRLQYIKNIIPTQYRWEGLSTSPPAKRVLR